MKKILLALTLIFALFLMGCGEDTAEWTVSDYSPSDKADALNALSVLDGDEITEDLRSERMKDLEALNALDGVDFLDDLENQGTEETPNQSAGPGMSGNIKKLGNFGGTQVYGVGPGGATISL